jgi:hypothetical protein
MRKVSMVPRSNGEDSQPVEPDPDRDRLAGNPAPDGPDAGEVHQDKRYGGGIYDVIMLAVGFAYRTGFRGIH